MGKETNSFISPESAVELLGNMHGGYNISTLIDLLDIESLASLAAEQLKNTILMFDAFMMLQKSLGMVINMPQTLLTLG